MPILLGENNYGESRVRLLRVVRQQDLNDIRDLMLAIRFEGDFEKAQSGGDNRKILPADTMKNTVYALARQYPIEAIEDFCSHLTEHFLTYNAQVSRVRIEAAESAWTHISHGGRAHASAFTRAGDERRTARMTATREEFTVRAGIEGLFALKTAKVAFKGFLRDPYTTQKEDRNRVLSTVISAEWLYGPGDVEFGPIWHGVRQVLLETFAEHDSHSLQHTLYAMGEAVLSNFDSIREIHLALPEKRYDLAELQPFGMDNPGEIFQPSDEPQEVAEATLRKG